jgi:predicted transcriptional regulator
MFHNEHPGKALGVSPNFRHFARIYLRFPTRLNMMKGIPTSLAPSLGGAFVMATVNDLLAGKDRCLITISAQASVFSAAVLMNDHKIGSLLVMEDGRLVGILTERDILRRIVADRRDAATTKVQEVMTHDVICCRLDTDIDDARCVMMKRRIRHLPVLAQGGGVVALISMGDLNAYQVDCQERTILQLQDYIHGSW